MATTLIHNVRIFDGVSKLTDSGFVHLQNGLISVVGQGTPPATLLQESNHVVDGDGHTLLPGLIDAHVHNHGSAMGLELCLKFGVTTVFDMMSDSSVLPGLRKLVAERKDVADLRAAGWATMVEGSWPRPILLATTPEEEREAKKKEVEQWPNVVEGRESEWVRDRKEEGSDFIKIMQEDGLALVNGPFPVPSLPMTKAVVEAARSEGLLTLAHALSQRATIMVLEAGTDGLAHCFFDEKPSQELVALYKKTNAFLIPTLVVVASLTSEEKQNSLKILNENGVKERVDEETRECFCGRLALAKGGSVENAYETVKILKENGVEILAGTDAVHGMHGTVPGLSLHQELGLYVSRCGFTPPEALKSATSVTAKKFGLGDRGRIAEGLNADLFMVKGDATEDINCTLAIAKVWRGGVALEA